MGLRFDRVAFVRSGGAPSGRYRSGMLRALYERGTVPDSVVGSFVDAIDGAFIASHPQTVRTADELAEIWRGRRLIAEHTTYERIDEIPIEFHVVAVDVLTGEELGRDSLPAPLHHRVRSHTAAAASPMAPAARRA